MRFLEDKQIETEIRVSDLGKGKGAWADFQSASRRLDNIYNGIVFKRLPKLDDPNFVVDSPIFGDICKRFATANSPYDFDAIPIHILGSIYERFLGSVISATDKRVAIEKKPEVRKAGGVYYTPQFVVRYIVEQTVGRLINGKTPAQIVKLKFVDIACGSGSFLLGIFDELLRYHAEWYNDQANDAKAKKDGCVRTDNGRWRLSLAQRRAILQNNVFGVDIDHQAVEVAQLSLFLKLLEDERATSARQYQLDYGRDPRLKKLLPDLGSNIICGNSLIGWESGATLTAQEESELNPLDFQQAFPDVYRSGGFDAVVGNPPYDVVEKDRSKSSWPHQVFISQARTMRLYAPALGGKLNLFRFFIVRGLALTKNGGMTGMIVPMSLLGDITTASARRHVFSELHPIKVDCFPQKDNPSKRIFRDAKLSTAIFTGQKRIGNASAISLRVYPFNSFDDAHRSSEMLLSEINDIDSKNLTVPLVSMDEWLLFKKIHLKSSPCQPLAKFDGIEITRGEINQTNFREFISSNPMHSRMLKGVEISRYMVRERVSQGQREWIDERRMNQQRGVNTHSALRRIATQRITGTDERLRVVCVIIDPPAHFADSTNSIYVSDNAKVAVEFVLGILNSKFAQWRFKVTSTNNNVATNELEMIPFPNVGKGNAQHDTIVSLVLQITSAKNEEVSSQGRRKEILARKIASLDLAIDSEVYSLYRLTPEEIGLVESRNRRT